VPRIFPQFPKWQGVASFTILDDIISEAVFEQHVKAAGLLIGIGRFRPGNGGTNGRFRITQFKWENISL
jgi:hypothetical protein